MQLHPSLHKSVLAGTSRVNLEPTAGAAAALAPLLGQQHGSALWQAVAAQDTWQRAGYVPSQGAAPAACARDTAAPCPRPAEDLLHMILRGIHPELLPAWLAQAQARSLAIPHACLVPLIEQGMNKPQLREQLAPLLGARGMWLLAQHPEWARRYGGEEGSAGAGADAAVGDAARNGPTAQWHNGNLLQRAAALRSMRAADPAAALQALQADWPQEPSENRAALLPCLATGLSLADEDFLEAALDDKRKEVRAAARSLLAVLPGSRLAARCEARLSAATRLEGGRIEITLPEACDKGMKRDGIGVAKPWNMGEKAGWLMDMAQCVPPAWWRARWQLDPEALVRLLSDQEFSLALLTGLCGAVGNALRAGAPDAVEWFVALLAAPPGRQRPDTTQLLLPQFPHLPPQAQLRILQAWLEDGTPGGLQHALAWAQQAAETPGAVLPPQLSRRFLQKLQGMLAAAPEPSYGMRSAFKAVAQLLDVEDAAYPQQGWPADDWEHWPNWRELVGELRETLQFRNALLSSFKENKE